MGGFAITQVMVLIHGMFQERRLVKSVGACVSMLGYLGAGRRRE